MDTTDELVVDVEKNFGRSESIQFSDVFLGIPCLAEKSERVDSGDPIFLGYGYCAIINKKHNGCDFRFDGIRILGKNGERIDVTLFSADAQVEVCAKRPTGIGSYSDDVVPFDSCFIRDDRGFFHMVVVASHGLFVLDDHQISVSEAFVERVFGFVKVIDNFAVTDRTNLLPVTTQINSAVKMIPPGFSKSCRQKNFFNGPFEFLHIGRNRQDHGKDDEDGGEKPNLCQGRHGAISKLRHISIPFCPASATTCVALSAKVHSIQGE